MIELKEGRFKPEHAGKLNFYLSAVDDLLRGPEDRPSIACRSADPVITCRSSTPSATSQSASVGVSLSKIAADLFYHSQALYSPSL